MVLSFFLKKVPDLIESIPCIVSLDHLERTAMARLNMRFCCKIVLAIILLVTLMMHVIGDGGLKAWEEPVLNERLDTTEWRRATAEERIQGRSAAKRRIAKQKMLLFRRTNNASSPQVRLCNDNQCG